MKVPSPNLQVMIHYYTSPNHLFQTVTMAPAHERDRILDEVVASEAWFGGRFAAGHREAYMRKRVFVEERMYRDFERKYEPPPTKHPVFFYIRPDLDLDTVKQELRRRETHGESRTQFLLVDLPEPADRRFISFTLFDSHRSYERDFLGLTSDPDLTDSGTVFHIRELAEVYARNRDVAGLSFEVQVWDPSILPVPPSPCQFALDNAAPPANIDDRGAQQYH